MAAEFEARLRRLGLGTTQPRGQKGLQKIQAMLIDSLSNDLLPVPDTKLCEVVTIDHWFHQFTCLNKARLQPAKSDPSLNFLPTYMQTRSQAMNSKPAFGILSSCVESMQHCPNRGRGPAHNLCDLMRRMNGDQLEQLLLIVGGPLRVSRRVCQSGCASTYQNMCSR
jgi:hypothetical protein